MIRAVEKPVTAIGVPVLRSPLTLAVVGGHRSDDSKGKVAVSFLAGRQFDYAGDLKDVLSVVVFADAVAPVHRVAITLGANITLLRAFEADPPEGVLLVFFG